MAKQSKCTAKTQQGKRCKNKALSGKALCKTHDQRAYGRRRARKAIRGVLAEIEEHEKNPGLLSKIFGEGSTHTWDPPMPLPPGTIS